MTAALLVLADLRAVRTDLRGALFARFFAVVFMAGSPTKQLFGGILLQREYWYASHVAGGCEAPVESGISPFPEPRYLGAGIVLAFILTSCHSEMVIRRRTGPHLSRLESLEDTKGPRRAVSVPSALKQSKLRCRKAH